MKTLILNGSANPRGDTAALVAVLKDCAGGEILEITPKNRISPCIDCRFCKKHPGCALHDDMDTVYSFLRDCDLVVLASPIWYASLSGPLLNMASRFQPYFCARFFRREKPALSGKYGILLFAGGQSGTEVHPAKAASVILQNIGVSAEHIRTVASMHTDSLPAKADREAAERIRQAVQAVRSALCP